MATSETNQGLGDLINLYKQLSAISAVVFAPLARTYVGSLEGDELRARDGGNAAVVNLALRKLAFEAGEMLRANHPPTEQPIPEFKRDDKGNLPDLSLAYVAAAALAYVKSREDKAAARTAAAPAAPQVEVLRATSVRALRASARTTAYTSAPRVMTAPPPVTVRPTGGCGCGGKSTPTSTGGCGCGGGCGGTSTPPPQPVPCYDPCAGGLVAVPPTETCSCAACQAPPATTDCPVVTISCETKLRLRDCIKQLLCDLIEYLETKLCANAQPGTPIAILCNFLHCVREAVCPDPVPTPLPPGPSMPCLPCGYAVEIP
jgi:hypothetical protein